jgi:hypothetical protein
MRARSRYAAERISPDLGQTWRRGDRLVETHTLLQILLFNNDLVFICAELLDLLMPLFWADCWIG